MVFETYYIPSVWDLQEAGVFKPEKVNDEWALTKLSDKFDTPKMLYGNKLVKIANHIWGAYKRRNRTLSALFIGTKGSGKTELGKILSNKAIDNGYRVIFIEGVTVDEKLIELIKNLKECVIFIDEYGKIINFDMQEKMLTMLTDPINTKKLFILTENSKWNINKFLLNRPGRVFYMIEFNKLPEDIFEDYCKKNDITGDFYNELKRRYKLSRDFTFDQLQAIGIEHKENPDMTIDEIIEYLNVKSLSINYYYIVDHLKFKGNECYIKTEPQIDTIAEMEGINVKIKAIIDKDGKKLVEYPDGYERNLIIPIVDTNTAEVKKLDKETIIVKTNDGFEATVKKIDEIRVKHYIKSDISVELEEAINTVDRPPVKTSTNNTSQPTQQPIQLTPMFI